MSVNCCSAANRNLRWGTFGGHAIAYLANDESHTPFSFCPFCGAALYGQTSRPQPPDWKDDPVRVCFDVDGLIADDQGLLPYPDRKPYPWVPEAMRKMRASASGIRIIIQTARYMRQCAGVQKNAHHAGHFELVDWLDRWGIPHDEVYMGKCSADIYADDRGCRVNSNEGQDSWLALYAAIERVIERKSEA